MRRCHITGDLDETITLNTDQYHYLVNVLRLTPKDVWLAFNGEGQERIYKLSSNHLAHATTELQIGRTAYPIHLCYALPKGDKLERVIKHVSELGIESIYLWQAEHCVQQWKADRSTKKLQRLQKIIQESARQSHRADLLKLYAPQSLSDLLEAFAHIPNRLFLHTQAKHHIYDLPSKLDLKNKSTGAVVVLVGPEGGISERETQKLIENDWFDLYLNTPVLRTETAAVVACTIALQQFNYL